MHRFEDEKDGGESQEVTHVGPGPFADDTEVPSSHALPTLAAATLRYLLLPSLQPLLMLGTALGTEGQLCSHALKLWNSEPH